MLGFLLRWVYIKNKIELINRGRKEVRKWGGYGVLECLSLELTAKGFEAKIELTAMRSPDLAAVWSSSAVLGFRGLPICSFFFRECTTQHSSAQQLSFLRYFFCSSSQFCQMPRQFTNDKKKKWFFFFFFLYSLFFS